MSPTWFCIGCITHRVSPGCLTPLAFLENPFRTPLAFLENHFGVRIACEMQRNAAKSQDQGLRENITQKSVAYSGYQGCVCFWHLSKGVERAALGTAGGKKK